MHVLARTVEWTAKAYILMDKCKRDKTCIASNKHLGFYGGDLQVNEISHTASLQLGRKKNHTGQKDYYIKQRIIQVVSFTSKPKADEKTAWPASPPLHIKFLPMIVEYAVP